MSKHPKRNGALKAHTGYGIAMLMVFITSTVMIGASLQMLAGPVGLAYLGSSSQDNLSARKLAMTGMTTVLADIQSRINTNQTVDTSYTYPTTSVSLPTDPTAPAGATTSVGSYSATMTAARGDGYIVKVTATVGSASYSLSRMINLSRTTISSYMLDSVSGATAAYGLRKLRSAYAGSAIRVRRSTDNTEQNIGFDAGGNLDLTTLQTFLGGTTKPLDSVGSAAVAYGLRKLRSAYTGSAIRVRRSSDSTEQDIGFLSDGELDVASLMNFVGSGSGYVKTWYDQSGNGTNATQTTTAAQPTIVASGQLQMVNNRPAIKYDGSDDALRFTRTIADDFTILATYSAIAGTGAPDGYWYNHAGIVDMEVTFDTNDFGTSVDTGGNVNAGIGNGEVTFYLQGNGYNDGRMHRLSFTRQKSTGMIGLYLDGVSHTSIHSTTPNLNSLTAASAISIGRIQTNAQPSLNGYISEVIVYGSLLTPANRVTVEKNQAQYFAITPVQTNYRPVDMVAGAKAAYGLRRLTDSGSVANKIIRVRRSSDNTEQDIGWVGQNLDVSSLMTFVGSGSGYVTTWYDQSGQGKNLTQTTTAKQPMIVNAGTLYTDNGLPTIYFNGTQHLENAAMSHITGADITSFITANIASTSDVWGRIAVLHKTGDASDWQYPTSMQLTSVYGSTTAINNNLNSDGGNCTIPASTLFTSVSYHNASNTGLMYVNGMQCSVTGWSSAALAPNYLIVGAGRAGSTITSNFKGNVSELIIYNSALSGSNTLSLELTQQYFYNPVLPVGYVTKWYDQSGNGNDAVQLNPLFQPTITFNGDGGVKNRPTIQFSSDYNANGYGTWLSSSSGMPTSANYSKNAVFSYRPTALSGSLLHNNVISSASGSGHAFYTGGGNTMALFHTGAFATSTASMTANALHSVTGTYQESGKTGTLYLFNTQGGTGSTANSNTQSGIGLGAYGGQSFLNGTISEAIVFNKILSSSERSILYYDQQAYYGAR